MRVTVSVMYDWVGWAIGLASVIAATGAWLAAWYPSRFRKSWLVEPMATPTEYLVRNNTNRRAEVLSIEATPIYPDKPDARPNYATDAPASATVEPGEAFGVRVSRARGLVITWNRRVWWRRKPIEQSREVTIPIKYS